MIIYPTRWSTFANCLLPSIPLLAKPYFPQIDEVVEEALAGIF